MQTKIKIILKVILLVFLLTLPALVFAKSPLEGLEEIGDEPNGFAKIDPGKNDLISQAGFIAKTFLSLLGIILIILVIYGGYTYMTAGGDQGKVDKGINIIRRGIIGLLITIGAFVISYFIFSKLGPGV